MKRPKFLLTWYYAVRTNYQDCPGELHPQPVMMVDDVNKLIDRVYRRGLKDGKRRRTSA